MYQNIGIQCRFRLRLLLLQSIRVTLNHGHGVQSILYSCQVWLQVQWRHLLDIMASASRFGQSYRRNNAQLNIGCYCCVFASSGLTLPVFWPVECMTTVHAGLSCRARESMHQLYLTTRRIAFICMFHLYMEVTRDLFTITQEVFAVKHMNCLQVAL